MIKLFNINPVAEALIYYSRRLNGEKTEKRAIELIKRRPRHEADIEALIRPVVELERELDCGLSVDNELLAKYFKRLGNGRDMDLFGFNLCSVLMYFPMVDHLEYSPDELFKYLRECSAPERMYNLCFGLAGSCETLFRAESGMEKYSRGVEKLQIPFESKWRLADAALSYERHIAELSSLLLPAAKIIMAEHEKYDFLVADFHSRYSGDDGEALIEDRFGNIFGSIDIMKISPTLFGFDGRCAVTESDDGSGPEEGDPPADSPFMGRMYLGICRHILSGEPQSAFAGLSEKMKTLSDETRLEILFYLCSHTAYGQELCDKFGLQRPALSYHVSKLLSAGFVTAELSGGKTYYSANRSAIDSFIRNFNDQMS